MVQLRSSKRPAQDPWLSCPTRRLFGYLRSEMTRPVTIWYITDNKPGHLNQLKGLSERLNHRAEQYNLCLGERWFDCIDPELNWWSLLLAKKRLNRPSILIGAGHKTHLKLTLFARKMNALSVVLMHPTLPLCLFDHAIIPAHDSPPNRSNILPTRGVLNRIQPRQPPLNPRQLPNGLILVGGESKHFVWNNQAIIEQIVAVTGQDTSARWTLSNSRRTPNVLIEELKYIAPSNLDIVDCDQTDADWLPAQFEKASEIWVTPDSVSMVYEAITSGLPTGLFNLPVSKQNRINTDIQKLIDDEMVTEFKQWQVGKSLRVPSQPLWESDRAALWLLERFQQELSV